MNKNLLFSFSLLVTSLAFAAEQQQSSMTVKEMIIVIGLKTAVESYCTLQKKQTSTNNLKFFLLSAIEVLQGKPSVRIFSKENFMNILFINGSSNCIAALCGYCIKKEPLCVKEIVTKTFKNSLRTLGIQVLYTLKCTPPTVPPRPKQHLWPTPVLPPLPEETKPAAPSNYKSENDDDGELYVNWNNGSFGSGGDGGGGITLRTDSASTVFVGNQAMMLR